MSSHAIIVNAITFARVPLIFAWMALAIIHVFQSEADPRAGLATAVLACAAMLFSGLTDAWDGKLARKWNVVSPLGKMADPLMDKVFYLVAFPTLVWQALRMGESDLHCLVLLAFTILYLLRDTWVTFMRSVGTLYGADVAAMWLGKLRTALSFPGAGWVYIYLAFHRIAPASWQKPWLVSCYAVEGFLIVLTLWSLWTYTAAYLPYLRKAVRSEK